MPDIKYVSPEELLKTHLLASSDFDLISFVPSTLSAEENRNAQEVLGRYCELTTDAIDTFWKSYEKKQKVEEEIATLEKSLKPGCVTSILIFLAGYLIAAFVVAIMAGMLSVIPKSSENPFVNFILVLGFIIALIVSYIKLRKAIINKKDQGKRASLKRELSSTQAQLSAARKKLAYDENISEDVIYNELQNEIINFSDVVSLLEKQAVILNDTTLSPSARLLAMEQLYSNLRQEKHNKAMEAAAYNSAERLATEMAEQENANRILSAFLTGYLSTRDK